MALIELRYTSTNATVTPNAENSLNRLSDHLAANAALQRRDRAFFASLRRRPIELLTHCIISLTGLLLLGWSPSAIWVFLILGQWGDLLSNALRFWVARSAVERSHRLLQTDAKIWHEVAALRQDRDPQTIPPPVQSQWSRQGLLLLDMLVLISVSATITSIAVQRNIPLLGDFANNLTLLLISTCSLLVQVLLPLRAYLRSDGPSDTLQSAGGPAVLAPGLLLIFAATSGVDNGLWIGILAINALILLTAPLSVMAFKSYWEETRWLAEELTQQSARHIAGRSGSQLNQNATVTRKHL